MNRRAFLQLLAGGVALAATPKFIFDYGKNLHVPAPVEWVSADLDIDDIIAYMNKCEREIQASYESPDCILISPAEYKRIAPEQYALLERHLNQHQDFYVAGDTTLEF
jgi:hypothetical protein